MRLQRLVRVYTCQNVKMLEISCHGSYEPVSEQSNKLALCLAMIQSSIKKIVQSDYSPPRWGHGLRLGHAKHDIESATKTATRLKK